MKNEELYLGMTVDVAKRYIAIREKIGDSLDTLRGTSQICRALENNDEDVIEIGAYDIGVLACLTESQVDGIYHLFEENFID